MNLFVLSERLAAEKTINTKRIAMIPNSAKIIIFSYILKKLVPHIIRYIIKKNLEKFQKPYNKKEPKEDFKFKSKKKVGEYIDYEEID